MGHKMGQIKLVGAAFGVALLGACSTISPGNAPFEVLPSDTAKPVALPVATIASARADITKVTNVSASIAAPVRAGTKSTQGAGWYVKDVRVNVPDSLRVSEANQYLPNADIVWRGDPYGDRRAQVKEILDLAISQAAMPFSGPEAVYVDVNLRKFHALSQKARATIGGWHTIKFDVHVRDVASGADVMKPFPVNIELKAYGGQRAINAEMRGLTQKLRIEREITRVMRKNLGA